MVLTVYSIRIRIKITVPKVFCILSGCTAFSSSHSG